MSNPQQTYWNYATDKYGLGTALWTPFAIASSAWFDASDASTITHSSGSVSQLDDKSGNDNHAVQATGSNQPTYIGNYIEFDGVSDVMLATPVLSSDITLMGVIRVYTDNTVTDPNKAWISQPGGPNPDFWMHARTHEDIIGTAFSSETPGFSISVATAQRDVSHIVGFRSYIANSTDGNLFIDGVSSDISYLSTPLARSGVELAIGRQKNNAARFFKGRIYEMIITSSRENLSTIQKLEGYLAHKWGLESSLPSSHPYKNSPPLA